MTGLEAKMAVDVLKPASGLIDALLGPKIAKVRKWANEKDLEAHFKNGEKLGSLLERYIERTITRVSFLSTLVFPQEKVSLEILYEPVSLIRKDGVNGRSSEEIYQLDLNLKGLCALIVDEAGMGKSTYAKHLCIEIFQRTEKVPILFDLADYEKDKSLVENLAKDFDEIDCNFDRQLFKMLLVKGKFFVILDGFDEAPSEAQDQMRSEIKAFNEKKGDTALVITSRPQERIPSLTGAISLSLRSLSEKQATSILDRYDRLTHLDIGKRLKSEINRIPERFLETPLLVSLLYRTYGFNNSIAEKISVFYTEIYEALYKGHDLTKSGYVRQKQSALDIDKFRELLRAFSFLYIIKLATKPHTYDSLLNLVQEAQGLCSFPAIVSRTFLDDLLLAVPLLSRDGLSLKFMHLSIAEYFASEYIANRNDAKSFAANIVNGPLREKFKETIEYLYEIAPVVYQEVIIVPMAEKFLRERSSEVQDTLYQTLTFTNKWAISVWLREEVYKNKGHMNIPKPPIDASSQYYVYGTADNKEFVAVCAFDKGENIPDGAWMELTTKIRESSMFNPTERDEEISELIKVLNVGTWYIHDSEDIKNNCGLNSIQTLINYVQFGRGGRRLNNKLGDVRAISRDRCEQVIDSLNSLRGAESNISDLLKGLVIPS